MSACDWPRQVPTAWLAEQKTRAQLQDKSRTQLRDNASLDEPTLRKLDSTLKKTTAFMKKMKAIGSGGMQLSEELGKLNLSKFVEEMAQNIAESKFKQSEVPGVVELCVQIAWRYEKFSLQIVSFLRKQLPAKKSDKVANPAKLRVDLRLLSELVLHGVAGKEGVQGVGGALAFLVTTDKTEHANGSLLSGWLRAVGWEMAGIAPRGDAAATAGDLPLPDVLSAENRKAFRDLITGYFDGLRQHTVEVCVEKNRVAKRIKRQERTRGDSAAEDRQAFDTLKAEFDRLKASTLDLADAMGVKVAAMQEEPSEDEDDIDAALVMGKAVEEGELSMWPDDEARYFYEKLLDLKRMVPAACFKDSEHATLESVVKSAIDDVDVEALDGEEEEGSQAGVDEEYGEEGEGEGEEAGMEPSQPPPEGNAEMKAYMVEWIRRLQRLANRENVDQAALDFVTNMNTHINRKWLVRVLHGTREASQLPFLARLLATLNPVMPDLTLELTHMLITQFRAIVQKRKKQDAVPLYKKTICVQFISELVKFGLVPRAEALCSLSTLVYDFRGHSVDLACTLLENCGMYLYRNADSHVKTKRILEVVQRKKAQLKNPRYVMLIDNAYCACVPPEEGSVRRGPPRPAMLEFVRRLVVTINEANKDLHFRCLRRIDWTNEETSEYALHCLSSPWLVPYANIAPLASLVAGLAGLQSHDWVGVHVVDATMETIRLWLETGAALNQQATACCVYLGELYNYFACTSDGVFKILYQLISWPEEADWRDHSRLRAICELMRTVAEFFTKGSVKRKMGYYLVFLGRYYWQRREAWRVGAAEMDDQPPRFPMELEGLVSDTVALLGKGVRLPASKEDADREAAELQKKMSEMVHVEPEEERFDDRQLHALREEDEEEEQDGRERRGDGAGAEEGAEEQWEQECSPVEQRVVEMEEEGDVHWLNGDAEENREDDDEFARELDKMMGEARTKPIVLSTVAVSTAAPKGDLTVPAAAKLRFERGARFADEDAPTADASLTSLSLDHKKVVVEKKEGAGGGGGGGAGEGDRPRIALVTRSKNNKVVLRQVEIADDRLERQWEEGKRREAAEREHMKRITMGLTRRMEEE